MAQSWKYTENTASGHKGRSILLIPLIENALTDHYSYGLTRVFLFYARSQVVTLAHTMEPSHKNLIFFYRNPLR